MATIDSQVHCYEANTPKRPWNSVPNWPAHATGDEMVAAMDRVSVDGAIFISAFSMYRYDASYAVEVQRAHPGRLALVKPVDPDDPDADRARRVLPVSDDIGHRRIVRVDRLDDGEPAGMGPLHVHRVAGVVAVHGKGGDEDRAVDADLVHGRHHLITRDVIGPVWHTMPGSLRGVRLIGMDLRIDDRHWGSSSVPSELVSQQVRIRRARRRA